MHLSSRHEHRTAWRALLLGFGVVVFGAVAMPASALTLKSGAPSRYTVNAGDTLWGIAARFLDQPWQWRELWRRNPQVVAPERLYPGDVIVLGGIEENAPRVALERARGQTVRLSPGVRRAPPRDAIPSLPLERIKFFLADYQIVDPSILEGAPTVVAGDAQRLLSGPGDTLYAHGRLPAAGTVLGIYRSGTDYRSRDASETLGVELRRLGHVRVRHRIDDVGELEVLDTVQEIRNGDYLLDLDEGRIATQFLPRAPENPVSATILSVPEGVRFIGRFDVITIDRGSADGLEPGHVLQVMRQGERVHDDMHDAWVTLPATFAGEVMVFRVFDHLSYALVMRASQALAVGDRLVVPQDLRKMAAQGDSR